MLKFRDEGDPKEESGRMTSARNFEIRGEGFLVLFMGKNIFRLPSGKASLWVCEWGRIFSAYRRQHGFLVDGGQVFEDLL